MTGDLIRQDNTFIGAGAPVTGDEITNNTALCGLNTFYIDKTNGASYVRTGVGKVTGDWTQIGGSGGIESVVAGSGIGVDDTDPANPVVSATGGSSYLVASVELTDAQIKALPTSGFQILAAPGSNKVNIPILFTLSLDWTDDYTNIDGTAQVECQYFNSGETISTLLLEASNQVSDLFAPGQDAFSYLTTKVGSSGGFLVGAVNTKATFNNEAIYLWIGNGASGNLTGGNAANTLKVTVYYVVVDL